MLVHGQHLLLTPSLPVGHAVELPAKLVLGDFTGLLRSLFLFLILRGYLSTEGLAGVTAKSRELGVAYLSRYFARWVFYRTDKTAY
jgi:hypothetical protein